MPFSDHTRLQKSVSADFPGWSGSGGMMGGGSSKGGAPKKSDANNTLRSNAKAKIVEVLGEGEIVGLVDGAKSIFFDATALQNTDGSYNFKGVTWQQRTGQPEQPLLTGVTQSETPYAVNVEVKSAQTPPIRTIADLNATAVRIIVNIPSLVIQDQKSGSLLPTDLDYVIERRPAGGAWTEIKRELFLQQKTTSPFQKASVIELPEGGHPYSIRVRKVNPDSTVEFHQNSMIWESYVVLVEGRFTYPNTAMVAMDLDASNFGTSIPARYYDVKGLIIQVPSNYDPETRAYNGFWDGTFKRAWSNNPAWIFYDLITNNRYGLGEYIDGTKVDKFGLYEIAQWCDGLVDNGFGGKEPRYTYNGVINSRDDAFKVLQQITTSFRGMAFWSVGQVFAVGDMPRDVDKIISPANVIGGSFKYSRTAKKTRNTVAMVTWNDPEDFYRPAIEVVQHDDGLDRFGWRQTDIQAVGCTSRGLAHRIGRWTLDTEHTATESVEFEMGLDALAKDPIKPGHIIAIADPRKAQTRIGGRVADRNGTRITLDKAFEPLAASSYRLSVVLASGGIHTSDIIAFENGNLVARLKDNLPEPCVLGAMWAITGTDVRPRQYRVLSVTEPKKSTFKIAALFHDPQKYARVEEGIVLDPIRYTRPRSKLKPVTNVKINENQVFRNGVPHTDVVISWSPADDWLSSSYSLYLTGPDGDVDMGTTTAPSMTLTDLASGEWTVYVTALGVGGARAEPAEKAFTVKGWDGAAGPTITNLRVRDTGTGVFNGRDAVLDWDLAWPAGTAPYAVDFIIRVFDIETRELLSDWVSPGQNFTYYFDDNVADGGPRRKFWVQVRARDVLSREGSPASLVCENPAPALIIPNVTPTTESIFVSYDPPLDSDFAGGLLWMERAPGFDPLATKPAYDGSNTLINLPAVKEVFYYVRFAAYDAFGKTGLNISPEQRVYVTNKIIDVDAPEIPEGLALSTEFETTVSGPSALIRGKWKASVAPNFKSFQVEIRRKQDQAWTRYAMTDPVWEIHGLQPGETYQVRVRALNSSEKESGWSEIKEIVAALNMVAPDPVTELTAEGAFQNAFLSWKDPANRDLAYVEILGSDTAKGLREPMGRAMPGQQSFSDPTLAAKGQRFYWARTANTSGTVSEVFVGPVQATSAGITKEMLASKILDQTAFAEGLTVIGTYDGVPPVAGWDGPLIIINKRDGKLYQLKDGAWSLVVAEVKVEDIVGKITSDMLAEIDAAKLAGQLTSEQIKSLEANKLVGQIVDAQLQSLGVNKLIGQLKASQLEAIEATKLIGTISADQIAAIEATKLIGQLTSDQIKAIEAAKLIGTLAASQLAAIEATKLIGQLSPGQIAALEATKLIGSLSSDQIASIAAAKVAGQLSSDQIQSLLATKIAGQLSSGQLAGIESSKLIGQIVDGQLQSISANKLNGQLTSDQIQSLAAAKLAGQITETQITDNAISTAKLRAAAIEADKIAAGAVTASKLQVASSNLMFNGDLSQGLLGFFDGPDMGIDTYWVPAGFKGLRTHVSGVPTKGTYRDVSFCRVDAAGNRLTYPVTPGALYELSAAVSAHRCTAQLYYEWLNAAGAVIGYTGAGGDVRSNGAQGGDVRSFPRAVLFGTAPAGATQVNLRGRMLFTGEEDVYVFWSALQFTSAVAGQREGSPYVDPGVTTITGSSVLTGSLHADKIIAGTITAGQMQARTITATQIATGTLTANEIGANAITAYHISSRTITAGQIAAGTLTANEIGAYVITGEKIAGRTITAGNLVAHSITADEIAVRSIVGDNIAGRTIQAYNLIANSITANEVGVRSLVGDNIAGRTIQAYNLIANSITADEIAVRSIKGDNIAGYTIQAYNLIANSITAGQIAGQTIVGWNIAGRTIEAGNLVAGSITAGEIKAGAITGDRIAGRTISATNLIAGTITAGEIAARSITGDNIAGRTIQAYNLIAGSITAGEIAANTLTANQIAANTIVAWNIAADTLTAREIRARSISADRLVVNSITADQIAANTIVGWNISARTLTAAHLTANTITAGEIAAKTIVAWNIAAGTITGDEIRGNSVHADRLIANSITAGQISAGAIRAEAIAAGAITADSLAVGLTTGNFLFNSDFQANNAGFFPTGYSDGVAPEQGQRTDWAPAGMGSAMIHRSGNPSNRQYADATLHRRTQNGWESSYPVSPGQRYEFTSYVSIHRARAQLYLFFVDAAGNWIKVEGSNEQTSWQSNGPLEQWMRLGVFGTAPDGAVRVIPCCRTIWTGESDPYTFWTGLYLGKATRNQSQFSSWARGSSTVIDGGIVATNSLHADKIIAGSITADKIRANSITGDQISATTISGWHIQANSIYADRIQIGSGNSMASWLGGPGNTQLNGAYISANSISAQTLKVGARGLTFIGIEFSGNKASQQLSWTGGHIAWVDDNGNQQHTAIAAGSVPWGGWVGVTWFKGRNYLDWSNDTNGGWNRDYAHPDAVPMCFYSGWTGLNVLKGGSTIDGTRINTGTITANEIAVGAIQAGHIAAGSITAEKIAAGTITADIINGGTITASSAILLGSGAFQLDAQNRMLRIYTPQHTEAVSIGNIGRFDGQGDNGAHGIIIRGDGNRVMLRADGTGAHLDAAFIKDLRVQNGQIADLAVDTIKIKDNSVSQSFGSYSGGQSTRITFRVKGNGAVSCMGFRRGNAPNPTYNRNGNLYITRIGAGGDRTPVASIPGAYFPVSAGQVMLPTSLMGIDTPGPGDWTYEILDDNPDGVGGVFLQVTELTK